jgi:hypothetical protein
MIYIRIYIYTLYIILFHMIQYLIDAGRSPAAEAMFGCRCCLVLATAQPPAERRKRAIATWSSYFFSSRREMVPRRQVKKGIQHHHSQIYACFDPFLIRYQASFFPVNMGICPRSRCWITIGNRKFHKWPISSAAAQSETTDSARDWGAE